MTTEDTNWDLIKNRYEFSGVSAEQLAQEFEVSLATIEYAVEKQGWVRRDIKDVVKKLDYSSESIEQLKGILSDKYTLAELLKDKSLQPKYHLLEMAILSKAVDVINNINPELPSAGLQLSQALKGIKRLYETGHPTGGNKVEEEGSKGVTVKILNQIG